MSQNKEQKPKSRFRIVDSRAMVDHGVYWADSKAEAREMWARAHGWDSFKESSSYGDDKLMVARVPIHFATIACGECGSETDITLGHADAICCSFCKTVIDLGAS